MSVAQKKPNISNYQFMCALLYIIENGCKWRALPKKYGNRHTIYVKFNRWSKNRTISRIFEELQKLDIIDIRTEQMYFILTVPVSKCILMRQMQENQAANKVLDPLKGTDNENKPCLYIHTICYDFALIFRKLP